MIFGRVVVRLTSVHCSVRSRHHLAGLLGANIGHSVLPASFVTAWKQLGDDGHVKLFDLDVQQLTIDDVLQEIRQQPFQGIAVTMPCKEAVMDSLDQLTLDARQMGSVNYIEAVRASDQPVQLIGHNLDWSGIRDALCAKLSRSDTQGPVCVVGAGGVSRAAIYALVQMGINEIRVTDPDHERSVAMVEELTATLDGSVALVAEKTLTNALRESEGVVNCSPVGMTGGPAGSPVPNQLLTETSTLKWAFDVVCYPVETPFVQMAEHSGLTTIRGDAMNRHVRLGMFAMLNGVEPAELPHGLFE